jgi:hypothetical protein
MLRAPANPRGVSVGPPRLDQGGQPKIFWRPSRKTVFAAGLLELVFSRLDFDISPG